MIVDKTGFYAKLQSVCSYQVKHSVIMWKHFNNILILLLYFLPCFNSLHCDCSTQVLWKEECVYLDLDECTSCEPIKCKVVKIT